MARRQVSFTLDDDLQDALKAEAEARKTTLSAIIRELLVLSLQQPPPLWLTSREAPAE